MQRSRLLVTDHAAHAPRQATVSLIMALDVSDQGWCGMLKTVC